MIVNEISLWGAALIAFLVVVAMLALAFVDRKMLLPISSAMLAGSLFRGQCPDGGDCAVDDSQRSTETKCTIILKLHKYEETILA